MKKLPINELEGGGVRSLEVNEGGGGYTPVCTCCSALSHPTLKYMQSMMLYIIFLRLIKLSVSVKVIQGGGLNSKALAVKILNCVHCRV